MTWTISSVQNVSLEDSLPTRPGFVIQHEEGSSPLLMLVFEDQKTAQDCANAMKRIFDKAVGIRGQI
jgi:hypothetical protein